MNKVEILYSALIDEISNICNNHAKAEAYWKTLDADNKTTFDSITELLSTHERSLAISRRESVLFEQYVELQDLIGQFNNSFSNYPDFNFNKFNFIISISKKISHSSSIIPEQATSVEFTFINFTHNYNSNAFVTNTNDIHNNLLWCNPVNLDSIQSLITFDTNIDCWYALLSAVNTIDFNSSKDYIFYSKNHPIDSIKKENLCALLKIYMVSKGVAITPNLTYTRNPHNSSIDQLSPTHDYVQFTDVISILGEYNNRSDILTKYISIFHIVENFMFKVPIVLLERGNSGNMFSIRDFKRLYKSVDMDEQKALKNLFKSGFELAFSGGKLNDHFHTNWVSFINADPGEKSDIINFLSLLGIKDGENVPKASFYDFISRVVYQIRCSIVHNKETEFHISSENFPTGCRLILEKYLFEMLEELIFALICKNNDIVWYTKDKIQLWNKSA